MMTTAISINSLKINKKFGIESTYDERFYTTEYNENNYSKEQIERAARLGREIEEKKNKAYK